MMPNYITVELETLLTKQFCDAGRNSLRELENRLEIKGPCHYVEVKEAFFAQATKMIDEGAKLTGIEDEDLSIKGIFKLVSLGAKAGYMIVRDGEHIADLSTYAGTWIPMK